MQTNRAKFLEQVLKLFRWITPALCVVCLMGLYIFFTAQPRALAQSAVATPSQSAAAASAQPTATPVLSPTKSLTPTASPTKFLTPTASATSTLSSPTSSGIRNATRLPPPMNVGTATPTAVPTQSSPTPTASRTTVLANGTITGKYLLSGRSIYSGAIITANPGGYTATTTTDGSFSLTVPEGTYSISAMMPGYLPTQKLGAIIAGGGLSKLSNAIAIAGNADGRNAIDTRALAIVGGAFGTRPQDAKFDARADLNGDGVVDILDLVLIASQFGRMGIQAWP